MNTPSIDSNLKIFLSDIYYVDDKNQDVTCHCAVRCAHQDEFDVIVKAHLATQNAFFIWSTDIYESIEWIRTFGQQKAQVDLIKQLQQQTDNIVLSDGVIKTPILEEEPLHSLIIEPIDNFEPLDIQFGVSPQLTVPEPLHPHLFAELEPTAEDIEYYGDELPPMQTYAVLDGAKMPYLLTAMLSGSGLEYESLFQGQAQEDLGEHAPYLVKLEEGNDFTRKLFTKVKPPLGFWDKELGIFIRTRASFKELRQHLRKFTKVQNEEGKWYYFRFWEKSVLRYFLEGTKPKKQMAFFSTPLQVFTLDEDHTLVKMFLDKPLNIKKLGGFTLGEEDMQSFTLRNHKRFANELHDKLTSISPAPKVDDAKAFIWQEMQFAMKTFSTSDSKILSYYVAASWLLGQNAYQHDELHLDANNITADTAKALYEQAFQIAQQNKEIA